MSSWWMVVLVLGPSLALWAPVGLVRMVEERTVRAARRLVGFRTPPPATRIELHRVAVLMAAHNEEAVIVGSLTRLLRLVPRDQVHVVSDASTDHTVELCQPLGVHVVETPTNVGKALALTFGLRHWSLDRHYAAVLLLDADTELDESYFRHALPLLDDPRVAAVAGCAHTRWQRGLGLLGSILVAHRERIYVITQLALKYGQTWRALSLTHIVPGFASLYRCSVLHRIDIQAPGLVIEDFNMTFDVHEKRLGRIAFTPAARAYTQDPASWRDYVSQTSRWSLGLWQTVRRHRVRPGWFAAALVLTLLELVASSLFFLALPFLVVAAALTMLVPAAGSLDLLGTTTTVLSLPHLLLAVALPDYALTCVAAAKDRRPSMLLLGVFFLPLRVADAATSMRSLIRAFSTSSSGRWVSPARRTAPEVRTPTHARRTPQEGTP